MSSKKLVQKNTNVQLPQLKVEKPQATEESNKAEQAAEEESRKSLKVITKDDAAYKSQFKPPHQRQVAPADNLSSYNGIYKSIGSRIAHQQNNNNSAFQLYNNTSSEDSQMGTVLNELRINNRLLTEVLDKVEVHNKMLSILIKDYQLNKVDKKSMIEAEEGANNVQLYYNLIGKGPDETITKKDLQLFLKDNDVEYRYQLVLDTSVEQPLVKERNFSLSITIADMSGKLVVNSNRILLSINIYTADNPPAKVKRNTTGNDILKGHKDNMMIDGKCVIQKLQIKEVTSHFRSGMVFLVIQPHKKNFNPLIVDDKNFIDYRFIKPLIIENIRVKAKITKRANESFLS